MLIIIQQKIKINVFLILLLIFFTLNVMIFSKYKGGYIFMNQLSKNIKSKRIELGYSQNELAKKLGYTSRSTIAKIESGESELTQTKIEAFAKALDCSPAELLGINQIRYSESNDFEKFIFSLKATDPDSPILRKLNDKLKNSLDDILVDRFALIPIARSLKAAVDGAVIDEFTEYYPAYNMNYLKDGKSFYIRANDDSMAPEINKDDLVLILRQNDLKSGALGAFLINGEKGTICRMTRDYNYIELQKSNPDYPTEKWNGIDITKVFIVGSVLSVTRYY
jgi:repressor LexA